MENILKLSPLTTFYKRFCKTVKPVLREHLINSWTVSLHDMCPFISGSSGKGRTLFWKRVPSAWSEGVPSSEYPMKKVWLYIYYLDILLLHVREVALNRLDLTRKITDLLLPCIFLLSLDIQLFLVLLYLNNISNSNYGDKINNSKTAIYWSCNFPYIYSCSISFCNVNILYENC